jgi:1-acyl-sn-glycerol-3-phosphate acyltransferase
VAPGVSAPYKKGTAALYEQMGQTCIPVATNVGYFWPRRGLYRRPGVAVVEFLDPIPPGLPRDEFMARLENMVEARSDELLLEAQAANKGR